MMVTVSVVVAMSELDGFSECMNALKKQLTDADEVIAVVTDGAGWQVAVPDLPVRVVQVTGGRSVTSRRCLGAETASRDVLVFLDDDVVVDDGWLDQVRSAYTDGRVSGVAGRLSEGTDGEERQGVGEVGRLLADGRLTHNFAADAAKPIQVDHLPAPCLSIRRPVYDAVGGLDDRFSDVGRFAETDLSLRVRRLGGRLLFIPTATATHRPAEVSYGPRRHYLVNRDHMRVLAGNFGFGPRVGYYFAGVVREQRLRMIEAAMLVTPYWGRADGSRRPWRRRLEAPAPVGYALAELAGLVVGIGAARRRQVRSGAPSRDPRGIIRYQRSRNGVAQ